MKCLLTCYLFLSFFSSLVYTQSKIDKKVIYQIEDFIITEQKDSALFYIKESKKVNYLKSLENLLKLDFNSLTFNRLFLNRINSRYVNNYKIVSEYINRNVQLPEGSNKINNDYVFIKCKQIINLTRGGYVNATTNQLFDELDIYIDGFNNMDIDVIKAKLRLQTYELLLLTIKDDVKNGKALANKLITKAKDLKDPDLEVIFTNYLLGFYVSERNVNAYIKTSEKILETASKLKDKEEYYELISRLINAYLFKGGYQEKCFNLLEELHTIEQIKNSTYIYYVQFIHANINNKALVDRVLNKFKSKSILDFINKTKPICKKNLIGADFLGYLKQASKALLLDKKYEEAFVLKDEAIELSRDLYSKEVSELISNYKTEQAVKLKEKEIEAEKKQTRLYLLIALLCLFLLIVSIISIKKLRVQSLELLGKNKLIKKSLDEKELLIKEMHHRVKNNFQLITSILELQSEEVEDQKVTELLEKGRSRIKSMSLIHQKLYGSESGLINFGDFINVLVNELAFLYKYSDSVELDINVKKIYFDVDTAIPLALILNELLTNSFKYAFKNQSKNQLYISLVKRLEENYELVYKDNGLGFKDNFRIQDTKDSGLRLVERLVKQLQGSIDIINQSGAKFEILFKDTKMRKETN